MTKEQFAAEMTRLAVTLGTTIDKPRMSSYYEDLSDLDAASFAYACKWLRQNFVPQKNLFPMPKEIRDAAKLMPRTPSSRQIEVIDFAERKRQHEEGFDKVREALAKLNDKYGTDIKA